MPLALVLILMASEPALAGEDAGPDFDRAVAPLLIRECLGCHSGARPKGGLDLSRRDAVLRGGKGGAALVPGKPDESPFWQRVRDGEMPPRKPLGGADRARLRDWIAAGAPWGRDPIDPLRFSTEARAGRDWWALQPVRRPALPPVRDQGWARNPVDVFVRARLEAKGLCPSPEADRRTLVRRLSFDLLGLPPTPEAVRDFVADTRPDAYERLVDQMLASPHYAERWARHWLDVVRYGESDGFERNAPRPTAYHYRDWVVESLAADLPYDEFVRRQLAGDVLRPGDADAARATGFLVAGVHNAVLGNDAMRVLARQDELEDRIGTVGQAFLGLTLHCARCHDHKFDPVTMHDYYRLASALGAVEPGERELPRPEVSESLARVGRELDAATRERDALETPARQAAQAARARGGKDGPAAEPPPVPVAAWDFRTGLADRAGRMHARAVAGARLSPAGAAADGTGYFRTEPLGQDLRARTLEAWVRLGNLAQRGGGVLSLQTPDGAVFDAIVFGEQEPGRWMAGSDGFRRYRSLDGPPETEAAARPVHVAVTYAADGAIAAYRDGLPYGRPYRSDGPVTFLKGQAVVLFGCRHEPAGGNRMLAGTIDRARLYDRALSAAEVAASHRAGGDYVADEELQAQLTAQQRRRLALVRADLARLTAAQATLQGRAAERVYLAVAGPAPVTRLLVRGQVTEPAEVLAPGGLAALPGPRADFGLPPDAPDADRRRALAAWITAPDNPLTDRVLVNRLWHYHFGAGLVETPSDFGFNGGRPSHPELLDWLAAEFAANGRRLKPLHRLIVTSTAYRQASAPRADGLALDAEARLLWRKKPQRLEGEAVRDSLLAAAGLLNTRMGGPPFRDCQVTDTGNGTTYYTPFDPADAASQRRSIYRFVPRGAERGLLDAFDCPDPAAAAPRRAVTTTPIQALALWNGAFALRLAEALADRCAREAPGDPDGQVTRAYQLLYQRDPTPAERTAARALADRHGGRALARVLINAGEFVTVD